MKKRIFLLILPLILAGCVSSGSLLTRECPEGVIPDRLFLTCKGNSCGTPTEAESGYPIMELWKWADGSPIRSQTYPICHIGYKEGENINNIYCGGSRPNEMFWSKKEISDEGIVLPEKNVEIELILDYNDYVEVNHKLENPAPIHEGKSEIFRQYKVISASCS